MEFPFTLRECDVGVVRVPTLPIAINGFPVGHALVDTGADVTLLPWELNQVLELPLATERGIDFQSAGGARFRAVPSTAPVTYAIEQSGYRRIEWLGTVFFVPNHPTILLGQHECLSRLTLTLDGVRGLLTVHR